MLVAFLQALIARYIRGTADLFNVSLLGSLGLESVPSASGQESEIESLQSGTIVKDGVRKREQLLQRMAKEQETPFLAIVQGATTISECSGMTAAPSVRPVPGFWNVPKHW